VNEAERTAFRQALEGSPSLFPLQLSGDGRLVQFVHLTAAELAAASFLDGRIMEQGRPSAVVSMEDLLAAARHLPLACDFIFHISHCGSTLISRLLGMHPMLLSLREPSILRIFPACSDDVTRSLFLGLWSRTFLPQQRSILKTTSFVAEVAAALLPLVPSARALCLYIPLTTFLPALLDGAMSDIDHQAASRFLRLQRRGLVAGLELDRLSPGERVAMSWLAEMLSLAEARQHFPCRTRWLDFDTFLSAPAFWLGEIGQFFGLGEDLVPLIDSPIMQRYAKKTEVAYDANFRQGLLRQSQTKHREEITRGLAWIARAGLVDSCDNLPAESWQPREFT
jgi:hypothetical protein